jgi:hypothetical protein
VAFSQEDVVRLDVPMNHSMPVSIIQCLRGLPGNFERILQGQLLLPTEPVPE